MPTTEKTLERWRERKRAQLREIVRAKHSRATAQRTERAKHGETDVSFWRVRVDDQWTLPAVEFTPADARGTTILVADAGRKKVGPEVEALLKAGQRVVAVDPFYFGESRIRTHDYLYALLLAAVGDRPLGLQASQLTAVSRWAHERHAKAPVALKAVGPRSSLFALIAAALEPQAISGVEVTGGMSSLREVIENNGSVDKTPELFCFGLLEHFDIPQLRALAGAE